MLQVAGWSFNHGSAEARGETMRDKRRRERQELYELRVTEWLVQPRKENI